jgi:hypothetical protein
MTLGIILGYKCEDFNPSPFTLGVQVPNYYTITLYLLNILYSQKLININII